METLKLKSHTVYEHLEELRGKCKKARAHAVRGKPQNTDESDPRRFKSTVRRGLPSLRFGELTQSSHITNPLNGYQGHV